MRAPSSKQGVPIGRYVIHDEIASGGMAAVHYGRLVGPVGFSRTVAIKRLHPHFAKNPDFVAMFLDEARLAARVQHPNVVSTLDIVHEGDELFLVMEYVHGESLSRLLRVTNERDQEVPLQVAAAIAAGALYGLHAAHEARDEKGMPLGIVHRDVSPQNVIVTVDGAARIADFGIAKAAVRLQTTREGQLKGKLAYMAPEQLRGGAVSRLSDVYAVGVLLWEMLTTTRLFEAETEGHLLAKVLAGETKPPSALRPDLPAAIDAIVMRALSTDPAARFATAREMALAIEAAVGLATANTVGEWVASVASDALARRAARIAEIERSVQDPREMITDRPPVHEPHQSDVHERIPPAQKLEPTELLPAPAAVPAPAAARPAPTAATKGRRHILVIDDSEVMLGRIRRALELDGHDVTATTRAVGNARHIPTSDLVIIDFHMPGIDGGTVIQSLRAAAKSKERACLFYLYTSDPTIAPRAQKLGFDGVFTDKGDEQSLVRQVRAVFRMMQMRELAARKG